MINEQIVIFIREQLSLGTDNETIITRLVDSGWQEADIMEAFQTVAALEPAPMAPTANEAFEPITEQSALPPEASSTGMSRWVGLGIGIVALGLLIGYLSLSKGTIIPELQDADNTLLTEEVAPVSQKENDTSTDDWDKLIAASRSCAPIKQTILSVENRDGKTVTKPLDYYLEPSKSSSICAFRYQSDGEIFFGRMCTFIGTQDLTAMLMKWKAGNQDLGQTTCKKDANGLTKCTTVGGDLEKINCSNSWMTK